jgi:hypothetical protein
LRKGFRTFLFRIYILKMDDNTNDIDLKSSTKFSCINCNYFTSRKSQYERHILTPKHNFLTTPKEKVPVNDIFECKCGKQYKHMSSLCAHKKKCSHKSQQTEPVMENTFTQPVNDGLVLPAFDMNLVMELLKQNQEFKELLIEQNEKMMEQHHSVMEQNQNVMEQNRNVIELATKIGNTTNIKTQQNNNFNLNVFLNETCKDAVCINDFIKDLPVSFQQLENIGQNGYVAGITEVIISYLKTMEVAERPLHCTDTKRDTMYIKEMNKWVKDDDNNTKMTRIFRTIANKNLRTIRKWAEEHPHSQESNTKENEFCTSVMLNSLGAIGDTQIKYDNKVLKAIASYVHIDRNI